jgi:hypothetical protein
MNEKHNRYIQHVRTAIGSFQNKYAAKNFVFISYNQSEQLGRKAILNIDDPEKRHVRLDVRNDKWYLREDLVEVNFVAQCRPAKIIAYGVLIHREDCDDIYRVYVSKEYRCNKYYYSIPDIFYNDYILEEYPKIKNYTETRIGFADFIVNDLCLTKKTQIIYSDLMSKPVWLMFRNGFIPVGHSSRWVLDF